MIDHKESVESVSILWTKVACLTTFIKTNIWPKSEYIYCTTLNLFLKYALTNVWFKSKCMYWIILMCTRTEIFMNVSNNKVGRKARTQ